MGSLPLSTLWVNLIVISGTWGSSFAFVKLITRSMDPFAFTAARGFIAMSALLVWLALWNRKAPAYCRRPLPSRSADNLGRLVAAARKPGAGKRS
jgi:drug/metabolite transporter (DMT)-like permease